MRGALLVALCNPLSMPCNPHPQTHQCYNGHHCTHRSSLGGPHLVAIKLSLHCFSRCTEMRTGNGVALRLRERLPPLPAFEGPILLPGQHRASPRGHRCLACRQAIEPSGDAPHLGFQVLGKSVNPLHHLALLACGCALQSGKLLLAYTAHDAPRCILSGTSFLFWWHQDVDPARAGLSR